jgi:hypothetical protein
MRLFHHRNGFSKRKQAGAGDGYGRIVSLSRVTGEQMLFKKEVVLSALTRHNVLMTDFSTFTNSEIIDIIDEHYFSLATTGEEAVWNLTHEMEDGSWEQHNIPSERMATILAEFTEKMKPYWKTPAMEAGARA